MSTPEKFCIDCRFCVPPKVHSSGYLWWRRTWTSKLEAECGRPQPATYLGRDRVTGEEIVHQPTPRSCWYERMEMSEHFCGRDAKYFEARP